MPNWSDFPGEIGGERGAVNRGRGGGGWWGEGGTLNLLPLPMYWIYRG